MKKLPSVIVASWILLVGVASIYSQSPGASPAGSITVNSGTVSVQGSDVAAVNGSISLSASATDEDCQSDGSTASDTFNGSGAYEWSEKNNKGMFSSPGSAITNYIAPADATNVEIVLKVKDDGQPAADYTSATRADSKIVKIVNPDGYKFTATRAAFAENYLAGSLSFQVTYKSANLPWVGNLAEKIGLPPYAFTRVHALPWNWNVATPAGAWITGGNFALPTTGGGSLSDFHSTSVGPTGAPPLNEPLSVGTYRDASTSQEIGYVKASSGSTISLGSHGIEEYVYSASSIDGVFQKH